MLFPERKTVTRNIRKLFSKIGITAVTAAALLAATANVKAEVPELTALVPEATGYEVIYKFNPLNYKSKGYEVDNGERYSGDLKRIGYLLKLTDKQGEMTWAFAAMDPFTQNLAQVGVPYPGSEEFQTYVNNLEIAGNSENIKTGTFAKGNIEFWGTNYSGGNAKNIPGAAKSFDFGDTISKTGNYGSMQIHNYLEKQVVIAYNKLTQTSNCELGIGNNPKGNPDWTFSNSGKNYKSAEMYVVGKINNLQIKEVVKLNPAKISFKTTSEKVNYAPGEEMAFTFNVDLGDQPMPEKPYNLKWSRTGDDGKKANGKEAITPGTPVTIKTNMDKPGFVRIIATVVDHKGKPVKYKNGSKITDIRFDGGAGVDIDKLKSAVEEPADFDEFWDKQKAKLAAIPVKAEMKKVSKEGAKVEVYAVSVDCAGPRPVTGYLTIPAGAKDKSLPASASYHGYSGSSIQRAPGSGPSDKIYFNVNAHGYELGKDNQYYKDFYNSIKSNDKSYSFDPEQNKDPETAYFNGMVLRVMRSLQFVKSLPQWNGKDLTVSGGSQGGLQTIWAAALDPDVTEARSSITWCCDFAGPTIGRLGGWRPSYVPALNYYDSVFHGKRIKCKTTITRAGLGDYVCPPSGLAILYNNMTCPKEIIWYQGSTHGFVPAKAQKFNVKPE